MNINISDNIQTKDIDNIHTFNYQNINSSVIKGCDSNNEYIYIKFKIESYDNIFQQIFYHKKDNNCWYSFEIQCV